MTTSRVSSSIGERAFFTSVFHPSAADWPAAANFFFLAFCQFAVFSFSASSNRASELIFYTLCTRYNNSIASRASEKERERNK